jgi:hypothetical protein
MRELLAEWAVNALLVLLQKAYTPCSRVVVEHLGGGCHARPKRCCAHCLV